MAETKGGNNRDFPRPLPRSEHLTFVSFDREHLGFLHALWTHPDVRRHLWDDRCISSSEAAEVIDAVMAAREARGLDMWVLGGGER